MSFNPVTFQTSMKLRYRRFQPCPRRIRRPRLAFTRVDARWREVFLKQPLPSLITSHPSANSCSEPPWRTRLRRIENALDLLEFTGSGCCLRGQCQRVPLRISDGRTVLAYDVCGYGVLVCCVQVRTREPFFSAPQGSPVSLSHRKGK